MIQMKQANILPIGEIGIVGFQRFEPKKDPNEGQVFQDDHGVEDGGLVAGLAVLDGEEAEAVDDPDDRVVQPLFPRSFAKVCVLPNYPRGHDQPMDN